MIDWTKSMSRTYEYYIVDPGTWKDKEPLRTVKSSTINRDSGVETRGSATIDITESVGECYIRIYLVVNQNGETEKIPLGTFLVQTPSSSFNGKVRNVSMDAYTPLLELKDNSPPLGYSILKGENIMSIAHRLVREQSRAPIMKPSSSKELYYDFVADPSDTWLSFTSDLIANADHEFDVDEMGRIFFTPKQEVAALQHVWTYNDDNSSILYPDLSMDHDLYGIPNVVEVTFSTKDECYFARVVNDDPNSPTSTVNRGREIVYRVTNPETLGNHLEKKARFYEVAPYDYTTNVHEKTNKEIDPPGKWDRFMDAKTFEGLPVYVIIPDGGLFCIVYETPGLTDYAKRLLSELSAIEYTVTYTHGYCPVRVGDCVRLNYTRAGLTNIKAKVISQSINCTPDCPVTEKAVFTTKLWG